MSKDYDEGYAEAIEAIKQALSGGNNNSGSGGGSGLPDGAKQIPVGNNQDDANSGGGRDSNDPNDAGKNVGDARNDQSESGDKSEDAFDQTDVPGSLIDEKTADQIAESEGYGKNSESVDQATKGTEQRVKNTWGNAPGAIKQKLADLYNTNTDWKKLLKNIIGHALSPEDKRSAYANKNVLVSQDRIARTDKDRFDHVDFIMCCVDSSGSMSDDQLRLVLSEVYSLALKKKPITLVVVQCDTKIQDVRIYNSLRELKNDSRTATVKGRGGTDLKPCWELLHKDPRFMKRRCELFMMFTDGYIPEQLPRDRKTMQNLCWCIIDNPSFEVANKDRFTTKINFDTKNIR